MIIIISTAQDNLFKVCDLFDQLVEKIKQLKLKMWR